MPHGGYKQSGYGKDMSMYAIEDYTQVKHVMARIAQTVGASFLPCVGVPPHPDASPPQGGRGNSRAPSPGGRGTG